MKVNAKNREDIHKFNPNTVHSYFVKRGRAICDFCDKDLRNPYDLEFDQESIEKALRPFHELDSKSRDMIHIILMDLAYTHCPFDNCDYWMPK